MVFPMEVRRVRFRFCFARKAVLTAQTASFYLLFVQTLPCLKMSPVPDGVGSTQTYILKE